MPNQAHHDEAGARLPPTDRDLARGLPEVELDQLAGPVAGALVGARLDEVRTDLAQVVVEDRLRTLIAEPLEDLQDPLARDPGIVAEQPIDLRAERIELRGARRALVARRPRAAQRTAHRVAVVAGAPRDLADREPLDLPHAPDLRPPQHVQHFPSPRLDPVGSSEARDHVGRDLPAQKRVRFRPAQVGDYSAGVRSGRPRPDPDCPVRLSVASAGTPMPWGPGREPSSIFRPPEVPQPSGASG